MLCDFEEINESSCWGNIFSYTRNPWVSGYTVVITLKWSYNLKIFITTCLRSLNYIIILFSLLHRLSLAITKTIVLSTKFTDHQCVITWSILFTSWSSYLRSIWWTVYSKTSPYYRCVHCCTCCLWHMIILLSFYCLDLLICKQTVQFGNQN